MPNSTTIVKFDPAKGGAQIATLDDAMEFGRKLIASGMAPRGVTKPEQVVISLQVGAELGFSHMQALANIPVINGRAAIMGDAAKAKIRSVGALEPGTEFREWFEGDGDELTVCVTSHRAGVKAEFEPYRFSVEDAKVAGLWGKAGVWKQYPRRMLKYRALGFHIRDHYSDAIMGLYIFEEARDIPAAIASPEMTPTGPDPLLDGAPKSKMEKFLTDYDMDDKKALGIKEAEVVEPTEAGLVQVGGAKITVSTCRCPCVCESKEFVPQEDTERIKCLRCSDCFPTPKRFNLEKHKDMQDSDSLGIPDHDDLTVGKMREKMKQC